jgi:ERCC4-type nuclease
MRIIIDTREQTPWAFPPFVQTTVGTLKTGDYALEGDEGGFVIERKSLNDFLCTISTGWPRFSAELNRAAELERFVIVVEGSFSDCCFSERNGEIIPPAHEHYMLTPQFVKKRLAELTVARGVPVSFAGNPELAEALALAYFRERAAALKKEIDF